MLTREKGLSRAGLVVAVVIVVVIGAGGFFAWKKFHKPQRTVVRIAIVPAAFYLPLMVAHDQHFFEKYGMTSEVTVYNNNNDMINALLHSDADVSALGSGGAFPLEVASPGRVRFIYGQNNRSYSFLVPKNSTIQKLEDLRGKKIGTWPSPTPRALLHLILDNRIGKDGFEIVPQEFRFLNQALQKGDVDALFNTDIFTEQAIESGIAKYLSQVPVEEFVMKPFFNGGGLVQRSLQAQNPQMYDAILRAMADAILFIRDHETQARVSLVTYTKVADGVAQKAPIDEFVQLKEVDLANAQKAADLFFEQGILTKKTDVSAMFR